MKHRDKILELRKQGKTYDEIKTILGCSKATISFHCGQGQKEKNNKRQQKNRFKQHPYTSKVYGYQYRLHKTKKIFDKSSIEIQLRDKINNFKKVINMKQNFTLQDVIDKFGENPKCYLTGEVIDIYQPKTYEFDHIIPVSRGGDNSLENLQITTKKANRAKQNMTPDEFIFLCKKVLENNNYQVNPT